MPTEDNHRSPKWGSTTKLLVGLIVIVIIGLALYWFQSLISAMIVAGMIAYLIGPVVAWLSARLKWSRTAVVVVVYLALLLALAGSATGIIVYAATQVQNLSGNVETIVKDLPARLDALTHSEFSVFGYTINLNQFDFHALYEQVVAYIQPALSRAADVVGAAVSGTAQFFGQALFVLVISFYMAKDLHNFGDLIGRHAADSGYQADVLRLVREFRRIWGAFLRGQALVSLTTFSVVSIGLSILGVQYSVALGLFAGLMDFVPMVGPTLAVVLTAGVALFQSGNWLGFSPLTLAAVVVIFYVILQQSENYLLVPRIIGGGLNLSPLLIFVGAIMGASLGGILGLLLAAPIMATIKLLGRYTWRKMLDMPPFPDEEPPPRSKPAFTLPNIGFLKNLSPRGRKP